MALVFTARLVDHIAYSPSAGFPYGELVGVAVAGLLTATNPVLNSFGQSRLSRGIDACLQDLLFDAVSRLRGMERLEDPDFRNQLALAQASSGSSLIPATTGLFKLGQDVIRVASLGVSLWVLDPALTVLIFAAAVPELVAELWLSRARVNILSELTPAMRRRLFFRELVTDLRAAREIRLFGLAHHFRDLARDELGTIHRGQDRLDRRRLTIQLSLATATAVITAASVAYVVWQVTLGRLSVGELTLFAGTVATTQASLTSIALGTSMATESLLTIKYVLAVMQASGESSPIVRDALAVREAPALLHGIELENVWFRYSNQGQWVLRSVSLFIPAGRTTALVGLNGAGKSTIQKLLCRFYDPTAGRIMWDGSTSRRYRPTRCGDA
jgi:ATP-binding cassette subfamily B protein